MMFLEKFEPIKKVFEFNYRFELENYENLRSAKLIEAVRLKTVFEALCFAIRSKKTKKLQ